MANSASGGFLLPTSTTENPPNLTLVQFIQTLLVGVSGIPGMLVRPKWQVKDPPQPEIDVNWIGFGIQLATPDAYSFVGMDSMGNTHTQRHEDLEVQCSIYGPSSLENADLIRDGLQITQNLEGLQKNNMGFVATGQTLHLPELINERWFDRYEMSIFFRREIQRTYSIVSILSASGTIYTPLGSEEYLIAFSA